MQQRHRQQQRRQQQQRQQQQRQQQQRRQQQQQQQQRQQQQLSLTSPHTTIASSPLFFKLLLRNQSPRDFISRPL